MYGLPSRSFLPQYFLAIILALILPDFLSAYAAGPEPEIVRGLENYLALLKGQKALNEFSSAEKREMAIIHAKLQGQGGRGTTPDGYEIEASSNDEWFIINGEKFQAKTYCFNLEKGDRVKFLEGSPLGACASAKLLNLRTSQTCDVWCE